MDKLYSTKSPELTILAYNQERVEQLNKQELMMERLKLLGISILHIVVHSVIQHKAEQAPDESVKTCAVQVMIIVANCILKKKCTCRETVNYTEETVNHVGLGDAGKMDVTGTA